MVFSYICIALFRLLWSPISSSSRVVLVGSKAGLEFWTKGKRFMFISNKYTQLWGCYSSLHSRCVQVGKGPPYSVGCIQSSLSLRASQTSCSRYLLLQSDYHSRWVFPGSDLLENTLLKLDDSTGQAHKLVLLGLRMTTNEDILKFLNTLKDQADKNTFNLRKDMKNVNSRLNELSEKVETAKTDAIEKENRDEVKMKEVQDRLEKIELKLTAAEVKCNDREKVVQEQVSRTNEFKLAIGLETSAPEPVTKPKTWTEVLKENKKKNEERIDEDKARKVKTWKKQVTIKNKVKNIENAAVRSDENVKKVAEKDIKEEIEKTARKEALKMGDSPFSQ